MTTETEAWRTVRDEDNPLNRSMFVTGPAGVTVPMNEVDPVEEGIAQPYIKQIQNKANNSKPGDIATVVNKASEMTGIEPGEVLDALVHGMTPDQYQQTASNIQSELGELNRQVSAGEITQEEYEAQIAEVTSRMEHDYSPYEGLDSEQKRQITIQSKMLSDEMISEDTYTENVRRIRNREPIVQEVRTTEERREPIVTLEETPEIPDTSKDKTSPKTPPKEEKEPTIFEKYGIEKDDYDEWDWLRDVGFSMMSNEGTGILDSFGIGAAEASENLREASKSNRELKNKLKIKEAEARAAAAKEESKKLGKTRVYYDEETGKEYNLTTVLMGTEGAIADPSFPGRWVIKELKKPTGKDGKSGKGSTGGYLPSAAKTIQKGMVEAVMGDLGLFYASDPETKKLRAELYNKIAEESEDDDPNYNNIRAWSESLQVLNARTTGVWAEMSDGRKSHLIDRAETATAKEIAELPSNEIYSREDIFKKNFKRIVQNLELGSAAEKKGWARTDDRFGITAQNEALIHLGNLVGENVVGSIWETSWFDMKDDEVKAALKDGLFTKNQYELLLENESRARSFMGDLAAKTQELADERQLAADDPVMKPIIRDMAIYAVNQIYGGSDAWWFTGDVNQPARYDSFMDYQAPPPSLDAYKTQGWQWEKFSDGKWGYRNPNDPSKRMTLSFFEQQLGK